MNDWYALTNTLDTDISPIDEITQARILRQVKAALPHRRKKRWLAATAAAVFLLPACGYAVVTGQFSQWFRYVAEDPQTPEASEDLLAGIGTVIGQSQTADGVTATLDGAIWDGRLLTLSLTLIGDNLSVNHWSGVESDDSWLSLSEAAIMEYWQEHYPDASEEDLQRSLEASRHPSMAPSVDITYVYDRQTEICQLLVQRETTIMEENREFTLHLENLNIQNMTISGPFEFTFTVENKSSRLQYAGSSILTLEDGSTVLISEITVSPFYLYATYETLTPSASETSLFRALEINQFHADGQDISTASSRGRLTSMHLDGGMSCGEIQAGPFRRIVDPATVEAIQFGDTWLKLSEFEPVSSE